MNTINEFIMFYEFFWLEHLLFSIIFEDNILQLKEQKKKKRNLINQNDQSLNKYFRLHHPYLNPLELMMVFLCYHYISIVNKISETI